MKKTKEKKIKQKSSVQEFADTLNNDPKKIIAWAKAEIRQYQKLIKILVNKI